MPKTPENQAQGSVAQRLEQGTHNPQTIPSPDENNADSPEKRSALSAQSPNGSHNSSLLNTDEVASELVEAAFCSDRPGRLSEKLVQRVSDTRDAIQLAMQLPDAKPVFDHAGALFALNKACNTFIGWHKSVESPIDIEITEGSDGIVLKAKYTDQPDRRFECHGTRWRGPGGAVSDVEVANALGVPVSYIDGLREGMRAFVAQHNPMSERRKPSFVSIASAAIIIGVSESLVLSWVKSQIIPFYSLPGSDEPWFKPDEVKTWAKKLGQRFGGLDVSPKIQVVVSKSAPAKFTDTPEPLKSVVGLRQIAVDHEISGVYFLCDGGDVVYVGQSNNVQSRIGTHRGEGVKRFDRAFFVPCKVCDLEQIERQMIDLLMPKYNADSLTNAQRTSPGSTLIPRQLPPKSPPAPVLPSPEGTP